MPLQSVVEDKLQGCGSHAHQRYLMFDLRISSQIILEYIQKYQSRLRDYSNVNLKYAVGFWSLEHFQMDMVAQGVNATLISAGHPCFQSGGVEGSNWLSGTIPRIFPHIRAFEGKEGTPYFVWKKYFNEHRNDKYTNWSMSEMPGFGLRESLPYSFSYCTVAKMKWDSIWNFSFITNPFDHLTWFGVLMSLILISLLAHSSLHWRRFSFPLLSSCSVLTGGGVFNNVVKYRSKLFALWMLAAFVLTNCYTGDMTSSVIKPPGKEILETYQDLSRKNFSLVCNQRHVFNTYPNIVKMLSKRISQRSILAIKTFLESAILVEDRATFIRTKVEQDRIATTEGWPYAIWNTVQSNLWIEQNYSGKKNRKTCFIGKELLETGERYFMFLPPGSSQLSRVFQKLLSAGIIQRLEQESVGIAVARRVQDRFKMKDKTTIIDDTDKSLAALTMEGKVVTIFFVWTICILISMNGFFLEMISNKIMF